MTWYAIACTSQFEDKIAAKIGAQAYIPKRTVWRKLRKGQRAIGKSGRIKKQFPLIPGYIVVDLELRDTIYHVLRNDKNVYGFVSSEGIPLKIRDIEIERLKTCESLGHYDETKELLKKLIGTSFDIHEGPLEGKRAKVSTIKNNDLIMEVDGFPMPVTVSIANFEKTKHSRVG